MTKGYIKIIAFVLVVFGLIYAYAVPFTKYQIYNSVNQYLDHIQNLESEALGLITAHEQWQNDKQLISQIKTTHGSTYAFRNRNIVIKKNTMSDALVEVSTVISADLNGKIQTQSTRYIIELVKTKNPRGVKVWTILSRSISEN